MIGRRIALGIVLSVACYRPHSSLATAAAAPAPLFRFHSNFWVNLNHFLYVTARARNGLDSTRTAVTSSLSDTAGFGALTAEQRRTWNDVVAYYQRAIAPRDILFDSSLVAVNNHLAEIENTSPARAAGMDSALSAALERAAPVYRALWWPRHDQSNRRWIDSANALLRMAGDSAARAEVRIFKRPWPASGIRVDASAYTNWAGAYTTDGPAHVNVSTLHAENWGTDAFESLFHEVLHSMDDSLFTALRTAFRANGKRMPRDPTHAFIFYTAGELTRTLMPGHVPFAEKSGMWVRVSDFAHMLPLLRAHWQPYIDGRITLDESVRRIAEAY